jgi:hypothetical protein
VSAFGSRSRFSVVLTAFSVFAAPAFAQAQGDQNTLSPAIVLIVVACCVVLFRVRRMGRIRITRLGEIAIARLFWNETVNIRGSVISVGYSTQKQKNQRGMGHAIVSGMAANAWKRGHGFAAGILGSIAMSDPGVNVTRWAHVVLADGRRFSFRAGSRETKLLSKYMILNLSDHGMEVYFAIKRDASLLSAYRQEIYKNITKMTGEIGFEQRRKLQDQVVTSNKMLELLGAETVDVNVCTKLAKLAREQRG